MSGLLSAMLLGGLAIGVLATFVYGFLMPGWTTKGQAQGAPAPAQVPEPVQTYRTAATFVPGWSPRQLRCVLCGAEAWTWRCTNHIHVVCRKCGKEEFFERRSMCQGLEANENKECS